jgi:hypothetical protein
MKKQRWQGAPKILIKKKRASIARSSLNTKQNKTLKDFLFQGNFSHTLNYKNLNKVRLAFYKISSKICKILALLVMLWQNEFLYITEKQ